MPHVTLNVTSDGLELPVMIGLNGGAIAHLLSLGRPIPRPQLLRGAIDTATNITVVAAPVLRRFNLPQYGRGTTHGIGGPLRVQLFEVSLSIPPVGALSAPLFALDRILVMEWMTPAPNLDVLIGLDVLAHLLTILDGPRQQFTLGD
jgi:hypothetical protein